MDKIHILWTTDNRETIFNMLSMYAVNSKTRQWWAEVNVIIWGASARLIGTDLQVQSVVTGMLNQGITVEACKACADNSGVSDRLTQLGVNVRYMGIPLTEYIKSGAFILTL
jgi:hypothetical protein